jgi:anaerobic ribonucleoside-triphosphate reductase activating protein
MDNQADYLDFAGYAIDVEGLGPGKRLAMWVRGCPLACPGCMTPELWASGAPRNFKSVEQVAELLIPHLKNADGLTISGGEPMEQPAALTKLVRLLRVEKADIEVLVYSGYSLDVLLKRGQSIIDFIQEIDILIDQPYQQTAPNTLKWRGSDNQRIHYLSPQSKSYVSDDDSFAEERPLQIQMMGMGQFRLIGIPKRGDIERYRQIMEQKGIGLEKFS